MANLKKIMDFYENVQIVEENFNENLPFKEEWMKLELSRIKKLYEEERTFFCDNSKLIAGVDEVGRGPIAGPVVASAVIFDKFHFLPGLDDSKKVNASLRVILKEAIHRQAYTYSVGIVDPEEIDRINIHKASLLAMKIAVENLPISPHFILIDGLHTISGIEGVQKAFKKGDSRFYSIAAASIVAKVTRDALMVEYERHFPGYNFAANKGYGTRKHIEALNQLGACAIHRRSYEPVKSIVDSFEKLRFV